VGVLLYLLLSGKLPIDAENFGKLIALLLTKPPAPLPGKTPLGEAIPEDLAATVMKCLEKDPAHRPQSMDALLDALSETPKLDQPPSSRWGLAIGLGLGLVIAAGAAVVALRPPPIVESGIDAGAAPVVEDAGPPVAVAVDAGTPPVLVAAEPDAGEEDAGEAVALAGPDAGAKVGKPVKPVKLTVPIVQATVRRDQNVVLKCLDRFRALLPAGEGAVKVRLTIEMSGEVSGVEVLEAAVKGTALETCMVKGVKTFRFPRNVGPPPTLTMPFTYRNTPAP
jgi:hypothetical protein